MPCDNRTPFGRAPNWAIREEIQMTLNKMCTFKLRFALIIMSFLMFTRIAYGQAETTYVYGYIIYGTTVSFSFVSPTAAETTSQTIDYPIPDGWTLVFDTIPDALSADGVWFVSKLDSVPRGKTMIQIVNLQSSETHRIISSQQVAEGTMFAWSPDSKQLALLVAVDEDDLDLFVYSMQTRTLVNVSNDAFRQRNVSWLSNGQSVATFTTPCFDTCADHLTVFDILTKKITYQLDLSTFSASGSAACNLMSSPDSGYLTFNSYCIDDDPGRSALGNDVYLSDLSNGSYKRITNFSQSVDTVTTPFYAVYDYTWLDSEVLLIGADYRVIGAEEGHQLQAYDVTTGTTTVLSTALGAGFSVNPVTQEVLLRPSSSQFTPAQPSPADATIPLSLVNIAAMENASAMSVQAVDAVSVPLTTDWVWSPDGAYAYGLVLSTLNDADYGSFTVAFLDGRTQQITQQVVSVTGDPTSSYLIPIGWVRW